MQYLNVNTAGQTLRLTLDEARQYFSETYTNYLLIITHEENSSAGASLSQVATIISENQRYTALNVTTVNLSLAGRYRYEVYGQNSAVNINPSDPTVIGLCEMGYVTLVGSTTYYNVSDINITSDVIYNGN
jgi:hypothetical protein